MAMGKTSRSVISGTGVSGAGVVGQDELAQRRGSTVAADAVEAGRGRHNGELRAAAAAVRSRTVDHSVGVGVGHGAAGVVRCKSAEGRGPFLAGGHDIGQGKADSVVI